ncbi:MAG: hypothetical protein F6J93_26655 [Oscillatoria sp. SIO1A7]|nr:hypothetical protein [Oscillatoria sp. SIO1A7]
MISEIAIEISQNSKVSIPAPQLMLKSNPSAINSKAHRRNRRQELSRKGEEKSSLQTEIVVWVANTDWGQNDRGKPIGEYDEIAVGRDDGRDDGLAIASRKIERYFDSSK